MRDECLNLLGDGAFTKEKKELEKSSIKNKNEFIVWDKTSNCFREVVEINFENHDRSIRNVKVNNGKRLWQQDNEFELFKDIGLTDINNKKIYADCSIFEFGYSIGEAIHIGYFYYSQDDLCYKIKILSSILRNGKSNKFKSQSFFFDRGMIDFKIIDTIQERDLRKNVL